MSKGIRAWSGVAVLAALGATVAFVGRGRGDDEEEKVKLEKTLKAQPELVKIIDMIGKGAKEADIRKAADELTKKHDLEFVMGAGFKPREKGGLGVGATPGAIKPDAVELKLIDIGATKPKKTEPKITEKDIAAEKNDWIKMAQVSQTLAEIAPSYAAMDKRTPAEQKKWNRYCEDMKKGSIDLVGAINTGEPKKVQQAADKLNASCNDCHKDFRDK
jgi:hypothetical protein